MIEITEHRNARYFNEKIIDCEINHPTYGWIPFSCNPDDDGSDINIPKLCKVFWRGHKIILVGSLRRRWIVSKRSISRSLPFG